MTTETPEIEQEHRAIAPGIEKRQVTPIDWELAGLAVLYLGVDYSVRNLPNTFKLGGHLALYLSAVLSLGLAVGVLVKHPKLRAAAGLAWRQRSGSLPQSIALLLVAFAVVLSLQSGADTKPRAFADALLSIAVAPITEELVYRGIAFGALCIAFGSRSVLWPLFISTICFALIHGVVWDGAEVVFFLPKVLLIAVLGLLCGAARACSGSLLFAVLCHVVWNATDDILLLLR